MDVHILLRHSLGDNQRIGVQLQPLGDELLVRHLGTKVVGLHHLVTLQTIMAGITLHVHDGIDTDRMGVGACACANNHNLPSEMLLYIGVRLVHVHGG